MAKQRRNFTREFKSRRSAGSPPRTRAWPRSSVSWGSARAYRGVWKAALTAEGDQAFPGKGNLPAVEEELRRLRAENQKLRMERELKKPDRPGFWGGAPMWE